jgi:hypothetical protein
MALASSDNGVGAWLYDFYFIDHSFVRQVFPKFYFQPKKGSLPFLGRTFTKLLLVEGCTVLPMDAAFGCPSLI